MNDLPLPSLPPLPSDERVLLLLGLLTSQERHGYEINDFIERQLNCVVDLKKATAYQLLDRLEQHGLIVSHTEQRGARPIRKVYSLTEAGKTYFFSLLSEQLQKEEILIVPGSVSIMFSEHLPVAERLSTLYERLTKLERRVGIQKRVLELPNLSEGVRCSTARILALTKADLEWLRTWISQLESEASPAQ